MPGSGPPIGGFRGILTRPATIFEEQFREKPQELKLQTRFPDGH
jgi:hypothetical protein